MAPERPLRRWRPSSWTLLLAFPLIIAAGTVLLSLPFATQEGVRAPLMTALFTATSATCVTGLAVVDTGPYWSGFGQGVILALIEVGGLSYMTGVAAILLAAGQRVTLSQRQVLRLSLGGGVLGRVDIEALEIVAIAFLVQVLGSLVLFGRFFALGQEPGSALWLATFHAVAAFNNAGFDITGGLASLAEFRADPFIVLPIAALAVLGASGITVVGGILTARRWGKFTLDSKLVMVGGGLLLFLGFLLILALEWNNEGTLGDGPIWQKAMEAIALSAFTRTTGFSTFNIGSMLDSTIFLAIALMFIGGASGSMAGGIKVNTFAVLLATVRSSVLGKPHTEIFGREVAEAQVRNALAVAGLAFLWVNAGAFLLSVLEKAPFLPALFETVSAFALVGLSTGITPSLTTPSLLILIGSMLLGRLGPLTVALALARRQRTPSFRYAREDIRIG